MTGDRRSVSVRRPAPDDPLTRHFTATGYVVHRDSVLLHWHRKIGAWLPPGGHVEENEDPVQAVRREALEETGIHVEVVPARPPLGLDYPVEVQPPYAIMVEDIHDPVDGFHQHIDMIYFCRAAGRPAAPNEGWRWVGRDDLEARTGLAQDGRPSAPPPNDVRLLALRAVETVAGVHRSGI